MESFQQMLPERAKVLRDGERKELLVTELVVGDIVLLETGDRVPADIRILECQGERGIPVHRHLAVACVRELLVLLRENPTQIVFPRSRRARRHFFLRSVLDRRKKVRVKEHNVKKQETREKIFLFVI